MARKPPFWAWASFLAMTLASLASLAARYRVEASNRAVGVMLEGQAVHELAAASGMPFNLALRTLKEHGLTGVALTEETLGDLIDTGRVAIGTDAQGTVGLVGSPEALARVAAGLSWRGGLGSEPGGNSMGALQFKGDGRVLRATSVGLDPLDAKAVRQAGLVLVARHANVVGAGPAYVSGVLRASRTLGATAFLAAGDQVLGQRDCIDDTAATLRDLGMQYLTPEFVKIGGDTRLSLELADQTLRLHSMQQAEVDRGSPGSALERYSKAYRERNVRWLLVRPMTLGSQDPLAGMCRFLDSLRSQIAVEKGAVRVPRPFRDPAVSRWLLASIGVLAAPWLAWCLGGLLPGRWGQILIVVALLAGFAALAESGRPYAALALGIAAPVFAYQALLAGVFGRSAWSAFLATSGVSLGGGLAVAGLLNGLPYLIEAKQALGVKAILIAPVLLAGWLLLDRLGGPRKVFDRPVRWAPLLLALLLLAGVAFIVVRSGNDAPGAVSDSELKLRALLDRWLYARPRTKEILLGHPALFLGLCLLRQSKLDGAAGGWAAALLALGAIGQSDIVDTLCHTHTPLDVGIARVLIGLVLGGIIGAVLWPLVRRLLATGTEGNSVGA